MRWVLERRKHLGPDRGRSWFANYNRLVERKRGHEAAMRLWLDCRDQWKRGNRGNGNAWITAGGSDEADAVRDGRAGDAGE